MKWIIRAFGLAGVLLVGISFIVEGEMVVFTRHLGIMLTAASLLASILYYFYYRKTKQGKTDGK